MDQAQMMAALQQMIGGGTQANNGNSGNSELRGIPTDFRASVHNAIVCPTKLESGELVSGLYYPGYKKADNKEVPSKLVVICWNNSAYKNTPSSTFKITFWGKYADIFARCLSVGQFIDLEMTIQHTFYDNPNIMESATVNGAPVQRPKRTYYEENRVTQCFLRQESVKTVASEVGNWPSADQIQQAGGNWASLIGGKVFFARPPLWSVPGTPDEGIWKQIRTMRKNTSHVPGNVKYGYCAVIDKNNTGGAYTTPVAGAINPAMQQILNALSGNTGAPAPVTTPATGAPGTITPEMQTMLNALMPGGGGANTTVAPGSLNI